jgi:hypothetical protein
MATTDPPKEDLSTEDPAATTISPSPFSSLAEEREAEIEALGIELEAEIITQHEFDARMLEISAAEFADTSRLDNVVTQDHIPAAAESPFLDNCVIIGSSALKYWTGDPPIAVSLH